MKLVNELREYILRLKLPKEEAKEKVDCRDEFLYEILDDFVEQHGIDRLPTVMQKVYKVFKGKYD